MTNTDPRIDAYIQKSLPFAQPVLSHLRQLIHEACPEVKENIKWGFPHFEYKGIICSMASFKNHCAFIFWKGLLMEDPKGILQTEEKTAMGHLGKITNIADLPSDEVLSGFIQQAIKLNELDVKKPAGPVAERKELVMPEDFRQALDANAAAKANFEKFSYTNRKEYLVWIQEAKTEATRQKRIATSVEQLADGKIKDWKYAR